MKILAEALKGGHILIWNTERWINKWIHYKKFHEAEREEWLVGKSLVFKVKLLDNAPVLWDY